LLGNVFLVPDLAAARGRQAEQPSARCVTRDGELLEPDGTVTVGPIGTGTGILSRKSELRDLKRRIEEHDGEIGGREIQQVTYRRQADSLDAPIRALETEITALSGEAGTLRDQLRDQRQNQQQLSGLIDLVRQEAGHIEGEFRRAEAAWVETNRLWDEAETDGRRLKERLAAADAELTAARIDRDARQEENVAAQVALGRVNEQLAALRERADELAAARTQRQTDAANLSQLQRAARARQTDSQLSLLRATAAAADAYARKESAERDAAALTAEEATLRARRDRLHAALKELRESGDEHKDRVHARELLVRDLTHRRDALTARIREDYGLNLADLLVAPPDETPTGTDDDPIPLTPADPEAVQTEIEELKKKITKLGSVNLEALDELAAVETRETDLRTQHDDLVGGQKGLMDIINEINTNSRKLFVETLNAVRGHFQELFRKLFGGGMADIVLEDSDDPLDAGIEVTARPPGKELRNLSLLSGGERTLTAIALLLAIFRSRPSPFCLLDEVDAALDEANTARLAAALGEFLDRSQFIIITHKKRTMAAADVLYGITMQESGVSKQVAVRFEDWPDEADRQAA
jgi:chromosome segregation protein